MQTLLDSPRLAEVVAVARKVSASPDTPVLIHAEPGSGAEELARLIHAQTPGVAPNGFVAVRCRGLPERAIEAELFGDSDAGPSHPAAVSRARPGTLFIEDIGCLGAAGQGRLATFIDGERRAAGEGPAKVVRVVATTGVSLAHAVNERLFRSELLSLLSVVELRLPPLRDRPEDIMALARRFLRTRAALLGKPLGHFSPEAERKLLSGKFPGNERELQAVIERAVIVASGDVLEADAIVFGDGENADGAALFLADAVSRFSDQQGRPPTLNELERAYIVWLLERTQGNRTAASRLLGVSYPTIVKKITDYRIDLAAAAARGRGVLPAHGRRAG